MKKILTSILLLLIGISLSIGINARNVIDKPMAGLSVTTPGDVSMVTSIAEDRDGIVWVGTAGHGLYKYDGVNYIRYTSSGEEQLVSPHVTSVISDTKDRLWVGTQKGINLKEKSEDNFSTVNLNETNNYIIRIFEDSFNRIFANTQVALFCYNELNHTFEHIISFDSNRLIKIYVDKEGEIWVVYSNQIVHYDKMFGYIDTYSISFSIINAEYDGFNHIFITGPRNLYCFDINAREFIELPDNLTTLENASISLMSNIGRNSMIFVANGVHYCYQPLSGKLLQESNKEFPYDKPKSLGTLNIITQGRNGNIWAAANDNKIFRLKTDITNPYRTLLRELQGTDVRNLSFDDHYVRCIQNGSFIITYDIATGIIYKQRISSINTGYNFSSLTNLYWDHRSGRIFLRAWNGAVELEMNDEFEYKVIRRYDFPVSSFLLSVAVDGNNTLWGCSIDDPDLYRVEPSFAKSVNVFEKFDVEQYAPRIYCSKLFTLSNGDLIACYTDVGLVRVSRTDGQRTLIRLSDKYSQMYINTVCEDNRGWVWVGTTDDGLFIYHPEDGTVSAPCQFDGENINSIAKETDGSILIYTSSTVYEYDYQTDTYLPVWKAPDNSSGQGRIFPLAKGYTIIGIGANLYMREKQGSVVNATPGLYSIVFTDEKSNVLAQVRGSDLPGKTILFSPEYSNMDMIVSVPNYSNNSVAMRYKIKGVTDGWADSFNNSAIHLNHISYGRHKVEIVLLSQDKKTENTISPFHIVIKRPWYISIVAVLVYILFIVTLIIIVLKETYLRQMKVIEAERLRLEKEGQERLNQANVDFFANMSHEFRTPLSLIAGAAKSLEKEGDYAASRLKLTKIIQRNSDRMLKLVSQMLDFNKLEHDKLPLHVKQVNPNEVIKDIVALLAFGASQKEINLTSIGTDDVLKMWLDADKFEKVMYNLLSNALKFTPFKGDITVTSKVIRPDDVLKSFPESTGQIFDCDYLEVTVADTGIGIPEESLNQIFERFVQVNSSEKSGGTGIGLYFAKSMVELHHGFIKASNSNGAVFDFVLPMGESAYVQAEMAKPDDKLITGSIDSGNHLSEYIIQPDKNQLLDTRQKVLVIDDDYEVIHFLKSLLSSKYSVVSSFDAITGYKLIESEKPDIIISDIMMLDMDGLQLCKMVKENVDMCHIPFILLTAKDTASTQIEGLNVGAEAYIVKPFEPDYLIAMIGTLLRNRINLRHILETTTRLDEPVESSLSSRDKQFLDKLYGLFEENLANPEVNIGDFAEELGISRTKMFYKVKELTGMTPNDYLKLYKLNRSIEFLKEDKYKISVISDMCGFSSPSHYALLFKKQFGVLPSEYLDTL